MSRNNKYIVSVVKNDASVLSWIVNCASAYIAQREANRMAHVVVSSHGPIVCSVVACGDSKGLSEVGALQWSVEHSPVEFTK
jgi:hypothetical protein